MCGNGVLIGMGLMLLIRKQIPPARQQVRAAFFVVAVVTTVLVFVVLPFATTITRTISTLVTGFVWLLSFSSLRFIELSNSIGFKPAVMVYKI
jgi:hypothetical protein